MSSEISTTTPARLRVVDGGHRAILFSRLTGIQQKIYVEGIHFRLGCNGEITEVNAAYVDMLFQNAMASPSCNL